MTKKVLISLAAILVFGFFLRVMYLPRGAVNFMYDQARDAYAVKEILTGNIKILGPSSSSQGLSHGVLYYYLIAPAYLVGSGNPIVVSAWLALINTLGGLIIFFLTRALTKKDSAGLLATFLYMVSFETTQYATWLSNPGLGVVTVPLLYLGLWQWINPTTGSGQAKKVGPVLCALGLGLSIQSQIFLLYHTIPLLVILIISRKVIKPKELLLSGGVLLTSLGSMILAEAKFGFQTTRGLLGMATSQSLDQTKGLLESFFLYTALFTKALSQSLFQRNIEISAVVILATIVFALLPLKKKKLAPELFMLFYLFSFLPVFPKIGDNIPHLLVGLAPAFLILLAMLLSRVWDTKFRIAAIALLILVAYSNINTITKENKKGQVLLSTQKSMTIGNQKALIDKTYEKREPFSINNVTAPLYINITWTYLYKWYGEKKYNYLPTYAGKGQDGQVDWMPQSGDIKNTHFLIIEPLWGIPRRYKDEIMIEEEANSSLIEEFEYGELVLQRRIKK